MKRFVMTVIPDKDKLLRLKLPVESPGLYRIMVHYEPIHEEQHEYLSDEFIDETAGKWVGDFVAEPRVDSDDRTTK